MSRVQWGSRISNAFTARNGVKQGGVLSPVLFSIYTDELLIYFDKSGVGCHTGHLFRGHMQLRIAAYRYSIIFSNIIFNASKSKFLIFGTGKDEALYIMFDGTIMLPSPTEIHLGTLLGNIMHRIINMAVSDLYTGKNNSFTHLSSLQHCWLSRIVLMECSFSMMA
jgi:hypothetical protein